MIQQHLTQVFRSLPAPSLVLLADVPRFTIAEANDAYLKLVRCERDDLVGKGFYEAFPNNPYNRVPPWNNLLEKLVADRLPNQSPVSKYMIPAGDNGPAETKYVVASNTPVCDDSGRLECILRTLTDVTEATLSQQTHSPFTSDKFLHETLRIARVGSWEADLINDVINWSDVVKEIYEVPAGYQPDFLTVPDFFKEGEHRDAFIQAMDHVTITGEEFDLELVIRTWNGLDKWIRISGKAEVVESICTRVYGVVQDIHARKMVEQKLVESHHQLESLIQTVDGIVWEADAATFQFSFVSDQVHAILGYTPAQFLEDARFWQNHIHPDDRDYAMHYCHRETTEMRNHTFDYRMMKADGSLVWIRDIVSVIHDGKGVTLRGLMVDVTVTKRMEILEHLEKEVLEMNSEKDMPLTAVLDRYVRGVEALFPQSRCSLLAVKDRRLQNLASPTLPPEYIASINGLEIGENAGSCGVAAYRREQVIVSDIARDPRWDSYRHLALPHHLFACWSHPVLIDDEVVATFAVYYHKINAPGEDELKVVERVAAILKVVLENRRNAERIEARNRKLHEIAWMQSHVVRAPLARLMGLIDLIRNYEHSPAEQAVLLDHVLTSAHALDDIIRDISSKTEKI